MLDYRYRSIRPRPVAVQAAGGVWRGGHGGGQRWEVGVADIIEVIGERPTRRRRWA